VETVVGLGERGEPAARRALVPAERAGVDQHATDHHAVARQELGRGVENEIRAVIERPHEVRCGERRVDEKRHAGIVRKSRHARDVDHLETRVAERLAEEQARLGPDRRPPRVEVARVHEGGRDAEARQCEIEEIVRPAVQRS
jgi:hypothetical protein